MERLHEVLAQIHAEFGPGPKPLKILDWRQFTIREQRLRSMAAAMEGVGIAVKPQYRRHSGEARDVA